MNFKELLKSEEYNFLKTNEHLGSNIILLGLGGSHAYGTNIEGSDVDIRGVALNTKEEILTNKNFEQFVEESTDTTIYSFNKLINLISNCNPNTIEMLGLKEEHYLYKSDIGQELLDNKKLFLSQIAVKSFGGYAGAQLRRLDNKSARQLRQPDNEQHILKSLENAMSSFEERYTSFPHGSIKLYVDDAVNSEFEKEIFMDINLTHYPLRDYGNMWSELKEITKTYSKLGQRNSKAIEHGKLGKHMMHLVRLYLMAFDILEKEEINTYRENDLPLLMDIRNGAFLDSHNQPIEEFFLMVNTLELRLDYAKKNTSLPVKPDYKKINEFVMSVNERVVKNVI